MFPKTGLCCASLEESPALMKMGLTMVLVGHVNFLLGALVHGVILRHINLHKQARAMEYAISNVVAFSCGLVGIVVGILAIVVSKNKRNRPLIWSLFAFSLAAALMGAAAAIGLFVSVVRAIVHGGRSLLTHCRFPDAIGYSSVTNECPFDPTRIYSTTLILWVPLIVMCAVQLVFCSRCVSVCSYFLRLPCCPNRKAFLTRKEVVREAIPLQQPGPSRYSEPPRQRPSPRQQPSHRQEQQQQQQQAPPPRRQQPPPLPPPQHLQRQHRSLPPPERKPLHRPYRDQPDSNPRYKNRPEERQLLDRNALERSSFWI